MPYAARRLERRAGMMRAKRELRSVKSVLITGAARRIGAEIATQLASRGWHVVIHYHHGKAPAEALRDAIATAGGTASLVQGDLASPEACRSILAQALALAPQLEALVNNAATFDYDDLAGTSAEALERNFRINTVAPILLARAFAAALPDGRQGAVVNLLDNKVFAPNPDYFSYTVSKCALHGATQMLAIALAPRVRVAGVAPGITLISGKQSEDSFARGHAMNPLGRGCTPDQIARAVEFILTTPSLTGQIITIDGGESLAPHGRDVAFLGAPV